jgi:HD-GYP domain-containing protein (c-di-GMP phosphodiesterase class II)
MIKSLKKLNKSIFLFTILILIISFSVFFLSLFQFNENKQNNIHINESIVKVNSIISNLYFLRDNTESPENKRIDNILNLLKEIKNNNQKLDLEYSFYITENFLKDYNSQPVSEVINEISSYARYIRDYKEEKTESAIQFNRFSIIFLMFSIGILTILITYQRSNINSYFDKIHKGVKNLESILSYKKIENQLDYEWQEEKIFIKEIEKIDNEMKINKNLLEIGRYNSMYDLLKKIMEIVESKLPLDRLSVAFMDNFGNVVAETASTKLENVYLEAGFVDKLDNTSLKYLAQSKKYRIINDLEDHYNNERKSAATKLLLKEGIKSNLTAPIEFNNKVVGFIFFASSKKNVYNEYHINIAKRVVELLKQNIFSHYIVQQIIASTTNGFVRLVEGKDNETGDHISRVASVSRLIAKKLSEINPAITPKFIREVYLFAPLHDIGKVGIPDNIFLKPGKLLKEEFELMKEHVSIGENIIRDINKNIENLSNLCLLETAIDIISGHHEKFDGSGYPRGKKGKAIPLAGRIVAVADVFDALMSKRPYKEAFSFEESIDLIKKGSGNHFDPEIVEIFESSINEVKEIYKLYKE